MVSSALLSSPSEDSSQLSTDRPKDVTSKPGPSQWRPGTTLRPVSNSIALCHGQSSCLSLERNKNDKFGNVETLARAVLSLSPLSLHHYPPWKTEPRKRLLRGKYRWKRSAEAKGKLWPTGRPCVMAAPSLNFLWVFLCIQANILPHTLSSLFNSSLTIRFI